MRVPHHSENENNVRRARIHEDQEKITKSPTFNNYMERKIEHLYCKSEKLGWSFTDFSAHILEVLVVLQHRKKAKRLTAFKQRAGRAIGA
jgi:hypothetical protein